MRSIYHNILIAITIILAISPLANALETDNIIGKKVSLHSEVLNESRTIQIYLSPSYENSENQFPVLYILDGQRLFLHGVSILQSFRSTTKLSPEFIVVGINNRYPERFNHFTEDQFLAFIEKELIPHINNNYRTTEERIVYGWEFAGAYVVESLIKKPTLFDGHIAASPYPIHETWFANETRIEQLAEALESDLNSHLYFSISENEPLVSTGTDLLASLLLAKATDDLRWKYRKISDEQHLSTALATLYQGLKHYFYGYASFQIDGLKQFLDAGGLKNFYAYNKLRAHRFGFKEEPEVWSMFTIVRNAMRANNFWQFEKFMKEFENYDLVENLDLRDAHSIAQFFLKHQKHNEAILTYQTMKLKHSGNARIENELGNIYTTLEKFQDAKLHYEKAVELADKNKDPRLTEYRENVSLVNANLVSD